MPERQYTAKERAALRACKTRTPEEQALLLEARRFLRARVKELEAMAKAALQLRDAIAQTENFKRVDGLDVAEQTALWDIAGSLEVTFARAIREWIPVLLDAAKRPGQRWARLPPWARVP